MGSQQLKPLIDSNAAKISVVLTIKTSATTVKPAEGIKTLSLFFHVRIIQSGSSRYGNEEIKTRELGTGEQVVYITRSQATKPYAKADGISCRHTHDFSFFSTFPLRNCHL